MLLTCCHERVTGLVPARELLSSLIRSKVERVGRACTHDHCPNSAP